MSKALMSPKKITVTELVSDITQLKTECMALESYKPALIEKVYDDIMLVENQWAESISKTAEKISDNRHQTIQIGLVATIIAIALGSFITLWVAMGTTWRNELNAAKKQLETEYVDKTKKTQKELQTYLEKEQFQNLGYTQETVFGKTVWYKK
jgi:hypothetical protein